MTHRFFVAPGAIAGGRARLDRDQARQLATVLRLRPGDRVTLVSDGLEHEVELEAVSPAGASGRVVATRAAAGEPRLRLTLALPLLRGDRSEEVIEAATQLGVARIEPFVSARSVARELTAARQRRWERIARESAETARRGRVPEIGPLRPYAEVLELLPPPVLCAWEGTRSPLLADAVPPEAEALALVIGPEGGLSDDEAALATTRGATLVSLGPRNLRSETAAIAAVAIVMLRSSD